MKIIFYWYYSLFFSVPGFEKVIGLSTEICDNTQTIQNLYNLEDVRACGDACDTNPNCVFFSYFIDANNYDNICVLFRSCMERRTAAFSATTYQKAKGYIELHMLKFYALRISYNSFC